MTDLVQVEYEWFRRSADWELRNIRTALTMLPLLNTPEQDARLEAVRQILRERKARR